MVSERLRRLRASHHAMWNYVTYRDAITVLGMDPADIYPAGSTRLDPRQWADLGWLTCFCGPPAGAVQAMRDAATAEALNQYTPDLIEPLREAAAAQFGCARGDAFEVVGAEGAQAGLALALMATVDPGDEVIVSDPGYFHIPSAVIAAGGVPVPVAITETTDYRLDPDAVEHAVTPRTRAICIVDPVNPYGTIQTREELTALAELAERHRLLLLHDVTHAPLVLDPDAAFRTLPALGVTDRSAVVMSVSHCFGMAGARIGFLGGAPGFVRGCLQLKAALTRLNTNLIAQHGALAALADTDYLAAAARVIVSNLAHLEHTLDSIPGVRLVVSPQRGLACALDVSETGASAQELMVALFARRVAVYPADGLGDTGAATMVRLNLSRPDAWAMAHLREVLADAVQEAGSGRWRQAVVSLLERKGTERAGALAQQIRNLG
jgi:aspartate/methionine/tyrosine aminotransferase